MIKELVASNMGIFPSSQKRLHRRSPLRQLVAIPFADADMIREINMVHHKDFEHPEILEDIREIYKRLFL